MKYKDVETEQDLIEYYECLVDFLSDSVPCLDVLIEQYGEDDE